MVFEGGGVGGLRGEIKICDPGKDFRWCLIKKCRFWCFWWSESKSLNLWSWCYVSGWCEEKRGFEWFSLTHFSWLRSWFQFLSIQLFMFLTEFSKWKKEHFWKIKSIFEDWGWRFDSVVLFKITITLFIIIDTFLMVADLFFARLFYNRLHFSWSGQLFKVGVAKPFLSKLKTKKIKF